MSDEPLELFQYMPTRALAFFDKVWLRTSRPSALNDPFDWMPAVAHDAEPDEIWAALQRHYHEGLRLIPPTRSEVAKIRERGFELGEDFRKKWAEVLDERYRIVCLTTRPDNLLMWPHYAESHKGFVVGFYRDKLNPLVPGGYAKEVRYSSERGMLPFPVTNHDNLSPELFKRICESKSPEWEYEKEWRMISMAHWLHPQGDALHLPVPSGVISRVIIGARCLPRTEEAIFEGCKNHDSLRDVPLWRARMCGREYRIILEPVES